MKPWSLGLISTCASMWLRRYFQNILDFNPFDCMLLTVFLLALIFIYLWLYWRGRKMPFQLKLIVHLVLVFFTFFVVAQIRSSFFIAVGAILSSTCIMVGAYGAGGDDHPSSSFFEGISAWVQNTPEPGEEGNSQPSQGVGQRLPGSPLEISSRGISGESLFRDSVEQPGGGPAPLLRLRRPRIQRVPRKLGRPTKAPLPIRINQIR